MAPGPSRAGRQDGPGSGWEPGPGPEPLPEGNLHFLHGLLALLAGVQRRVGEHGGNVRAEKFRAECLSPSAAPDAPGRALIPWIRTRPRTRSFPRRNELPKLRGEEE